MKVSGFNKFEILPTLFCERSNFLIEVEYLSISSVSLVKALITRTPLKFSLVCDKTPSKFS